MSLRSQRRFDATWRFAWLPMAEFLKKSTVQDFHGKKLCVNSFFSTKYLVRVSCFRCPRSMNAPGTGCSNCHISPCKLGQSWNNALPSLRHAKISFLKLFALRRGRPRFTLWSQGLSKCLLSLLSSLPFFQVAQ